MRAFENIRTQVGNEKGASIIIALVFLLICTVIAVSALNIASVNSTQRDADNKNGNQAYYTLSSAAQASTDIFSSSQGELSSLSITFDKNWAKTAESSQTTQLGKAVLTAAETVKSNPQGKVTIGTYEVSCNKNPFRSGAEALDTVKVTYVMDSSFLITATASFEDASVLYGYDVSSTKAATLDTSGGTSTKVTWK